MARRWLTLNFLLFAGDMKDRKVMPGDAAVRTLSNQAAHLGEQVIALRRFHKMMVGGSAHHRHILIRGKLFCPDAPRDAHIVEIAAAFDFLAGIGHSIWQRRRPADTAMTNGVIALLNLGEERIEAKR